MLKSFKKNREQKVIHKADALLTKGISQLHGKLYKQAMIEFQNAYQLDPNTTLQRLDKEFKHFRDLHDHEAALSIGLILIKIKKSDYELVNLVGNCARKQKNYKQANNLYRHALKINRNFPLAFYNLAASMGKVDKFDDDIKKSFKVFAGLKDYVLPEYAEDTDFGERVQKRLNDTSNSNFELEVHDLEQQIKDKEASGDYQEAKVLGIELEELKRNNSKTPDTDYENFYAELINTKDTDEMTEDDKQIQLRNMYNFGIFLLNHKKTEMALKVFHQVRDSDTHFKYLDMLIAIAMAISGHTKDAIKFFVDELGEEQYNRFFNINLGFMYKNIGNRLLATKYLAIGAELLEKSDGLYNLSDLLEIADQSVQDGNYKKALKLYNVAVSEVENTDIWSKIGNVYVNLKKYDEATKAFREILKLDPTSEFAHRQLKDLHDIFCVRAESFFHQSKFQASAGMYEKALRILRPAETIKQTASVYKVMKNNTKVEALNNEYEEILKKERELETEKARKENIKLGRLHIKRKNYAQGIDILETAFRMKLDKDVFVLLASIYKSQNKKLEMQDLLSRWNKKVEYEDKMKKFEKEEQRAQMADN
ncbi:MAG: tetratricopeptide repeat protein [Deltaproteobacteria bacterium]|jgi:tetratricopeptide (TPR) repeat protein|nr:tetratricopeptide repeat protein [Deltaproteobacteria bacterium]MBT4091136.1 tetratricopeptide repeat protein [Deltaproteobacteria bacterium]MBT4264809.1 tetratricopeptide repeat protein [Deltaproteobacteria bacterium]MBT4639777.1 tetratricopeptide repeat protein [Deltaproteobacteria bacterium]MBT7153122.1 tetratricopeptide repeat protein [Deltaproteobacteria bacterium]